MQLRLHVVQCRHGGCTCTCMPEHAIVKYPVGTVAHVSPVIPDLLGLSFRMTTNRENCGPVAMPPTTLPAPCKQCAEVMSRVECQQEEDWALLLVRLHNYSSGRSVNVLAEKSGGDAIRLRPPKDAGLLYLIRVHTIEGMPQLMFESHTLKVLIPFAAEEHQCCELSIQSNTQ
jgi:hypothetical protein